jgi:TolB-like protein
MRKMVFQTGMVSILLFFGAVTVLTAQTAQSGTSISLDDAIKSGARAIDAKLKSGTKIAVLNFSSTSGRLSDYVIEEMITVLVNNGKLTVVDRQTLDLIQDEMSFQTSGEVSDKSAQAIGQKLGAQSIVTGSFEQIGSDYRIRFRTIEVSSAALQVISAMDVKQDERLTGLLGRRPSSNSSASPANQNPAPKAEATGYPNGRNFSTGRKVGSGFLNLVGGLGSFTMGDWVGGLIIGVGEIGGTVLMATGVGTTTITNPDGSTTPQDSLGTGFYIGIGLVVGSNIFGFIRPFMYDTSLAKKRGTYYADAGKAAGGNPLEHIDIALIPDSSGIRAVNLSYSFSY